MFKLVMFACLLAIAAAKPEPSVLAPVAYTAAYTAPVAAAYTAPVAYAGYSAPLAAYSYSPYAYAPYSAYYFR